MSEGRHQGAAPAIVSPRFDFAWFVAPGLVALAWGLLLGLQGQGHESRLGLWIVGVLLVDVAHVYASLYRTYLDPEARKHHRKRLLWAPILCAWFGFLLHLESPLLFWGVLAYVAIFHFIKQHIGFALLYVRAGGETPADRRLVAWAVWAGTLGPVLWWHANLPTEFAWFVQGDLVTGLPAFVGPLALLLQLPIWIAFAWRRFALARAGRPNPMLVWLVVVPALSWHLGIVVFDDDRIFTITNVFLHGIPYLALVFVAGGRERVMASVKSTRLLPIVAAFYGLLVVLAIGEEALWDRLVWHDHALLFGDSDPALGPVALSIVVALLTVPQATHYLLDRWIWRVGPDNPQLARQLGLR
jgi:hypothetical protein